MISPLPDFGLLPPVPAVVLRPVAGDGGACGDGEPTFEREEVSVLVTSRSTEGTASAVRPAGARVSCTLHFPRGYGMSLRGCMVEVGGDTFRVLGDPRPCDEGLCPGPYTMKCEAEAVYG